MISGPQMAPHFLERKLGERSPPKFGSLDSLSRWVLGMTHIVAQENLDRSCGGQSDVGFGDVRVIRVCHGPGLLCAAEENLVDRCQPCGTAGEMGGVSVKRRQRVWQSVR